jgi:hypothetical protein
LPPARALRFAEAYSMRTFDQSHSSSSATSIAKPVEVPWPISAWGTRMVTVFVGLDDQEGGHLLSSRWSRRP